MTAFAAIGDDGGAGASKQAQQLVAGHRSGYTLLLIIPEVISRHLVSRKTGDFGMGRQPIGQRAMTSTERRRRHRGELTTPPLTKAEVLGLQSLIRGNSTA